MVQFSLNGRPVSVDVDPQTPLLWVLRESLLATGTKFGCGIGLCGACTVHLRGKAVRSCVTPLAAAEGADVVTIEGLSADGDHPLQRAWIAAQAPQCGYCQSGQLMAAAALLQRRPQPSDADIDEVMTNLCRCMAYPRIRRAIHLAVDAMAGGDEEATSDA